MRIGFDARKIFGDRSGQGNYSRSAIELLSKYYPENEYTLFSGYDKNRADFAIPKGVKIVHPSNILGSVAPIIWNQINMARDIRRKRIDIFHGTANELPLDIRLGGAKSVVTIHDLIYLRYPNLYSSMQRRFLDWKIRKSCYNADMIIAISEQTKRDLIEFYDVQSERIVVVYQGYNPIYNREASPQMKQQVKERYKLPDNYIVSVGNIEERKNLMLTLHAIVEGKLDVSLVACGRWTPYVDKLKEYAESAGIKDRVYFIHDAHLEELPAIYQGALASVYISLFEGFGIPILESMSSGVPVITNEEGAFREAGGDGALYVGPYDLVELIEILEQLITSPTFRSEVVERGRKQLENFSDEKIAANLMAVYNRLM